MVLAAVSRKDRQQITFGASCRPVTEGSAALEHAILEAISVRAALSGGRKAIGNVDLVEIRRRANSMQWDFLDHLDYLTCGSVSVSGIPASMRVADGHLVRAVHEEYRAPVALIELRVDNGTRVLTKAHVPHPAFQAPLPSVAKYVIDPGYLD